MPNESEDTSLSKEPNEIDTFSGQDKRSGERRPALVFLRGELLAVPIPLERNEVTLGRALDADVRINDVRASRLHARITTESDEATGEARYSLTDLGSTNGTLLNGRPITQAFLADGDKFEVGDQLIRFEMLDEIDREFQQQIHRLLVHDELTSEDRKSTRLNSSHDQISYAVFCLKKKKIHRLDDTSARLHAFRNRVRSVLQDFTLDDPN